MGAEQSSGREPSGASNDTAAKICYYELLGVERQATDEEIKKAYKRKALELHPDRNYNDVENATRRFAEIQTAYEILSDPQERAWYDSHRDLILRGVDETTGVQYERNIRFTSAAHIAKLIGKFSSKMPSTDEPHGFFDNIQDLFDTLAKEEEAACNWAGIDPIDYPGFGHAADDFEEVVKPFYRNWQNFSTKKSFSWMDHYDPSDAPDRATRRLIEKENKKSRDEGIRDFNDAVRHLVSFVRKRDPRYIPNTQTEADRQRIMREAVAAQSARSRAANKARIGNEPLPSWTETPKSEEKSASEESDESEVENIECVACKKTFKSEKQYEAHERSKKHIKTVQSVQRQMRKDNQRLDLDSFTSTPATAVDQDHNEDEAEPEPSQSPLKADAIPEEREQIDQGLKGSGTSSTNSDDEYASRQDVEDRIATEQNGTYKLDDLASLDLAAATAATSLDDGSQGASEQKVGKAKAKRAKKAARQNAEDQEFKCGTCNDTFPSKTKLFKHIEKMDHAQPPTKVEEAKKKVKR